MSARKFRWSKVYESSEEELLAILRSRNLTGKRYAAEASSAPVDITMPRSCTVWCAEGSLSFQTEQAVFSLQPGDALHMAAAMKCSIRPGISGYAYYVTN